MEPKQLEPGKTRGKCRKWQLRVRLGIDPRTGKYREKTRTFTGSYRQAVAATESFEEEVKNLQSSRPGRKLTFEQLAEEYVPHRVAMKQITPATAKKIRLQLAALSRHIGKMQADKLEPYMIQDAVKAMLAGDSAKGKPLSGTYVNMTLQAGSTMYRRYAIPNALAASNPFKSVEWPKVDTPERAPLTEEQSSALQEYCTPTDRRHAAVMMALLAGLRRSECINVTWGNINLLDATMYLPDTKGAKRLTAIPLQKKLVDFLLSWKECQADQMREWGVRQGDETTVCANELGDKLIPNTLNQWWRRNRKKLGCPDVHFHDLRHTFATSLASANIHPKVIQSLLRQKDDRVAMRIYTHVNTTQMQGAIDLINQL